MELQEGTALLVRTPAILEAWLEDLPEAWLVADEGPDTFSPRDVVGHLIHGERTDWLPRLRLIRAKGDSEPFEAFDRFGFREGLKGRSIRDLLAEFAALRRANLDELASFDLTAASMEARGLHPALGAVTVAQLLATWVTHDLDHLGQIARIMAKRQDGDVGPWKDYLGILNRR
jgi:uncharacterized damage-inducible protein DinB